MAQEYTVANWQVWETDDGPIRDKFGNFKGSVWFDEDTRQVDATFKTQPEVGDKKYGEIIEYTTRGGSKRLKFQRKDRPDEGTQGHRSNSPSGTDKKWQPRDDEAIKAQWAIGQAVQLAVPYLKEGVTYSISNIEKQAKELYAMVDRVKATDVGSSESTDPKLPTTLNTPKSSGASGYDKFKASRPKPEDPAEPEFASMLAKGLEADDIDINDIPF